MECGRFSLRRGGADKGKGYFIAAAFARLTGAEEE